MVLLNDNNSALNSGTIDLGLKKPVREVDSHLQGLQPVRHWQQKWERYMMLTKTPKSTYERYSRAVEKFLSHFPDKKYCHSYRMAEVIDYRNHRLKEVSPKTVRLELSAVRSFWNWMQEIEVADVFWNPARGVKVVRNGQPMKETPVATSASDIMTG